MGADISSLSALLAGLISFLSPCVLPLVPPYLCYMAGASLDELTSGVAKIEGSSIRKRALIGSIAFVAGFTVVFVILGAGASTIGQYVRAHLDVISFIAGLVIILMGMHFLGWLKIGLFYREARFQSSGTGYAGAFVMGLAFAFGWTPCLGPILGVILGLAAAKNSIAEGATLLAIYSAGLGIPFILAALFVQPFMNFLSRFKHHLGKVEKGMGAMLVLTGVLFISGGMQTMSYWLLESFPILATLG
ncbi:MAG: cytochrome c biogenesis CcdA family protein [Rhizobiaceae bacterium]